MADDGSVNRGGSSNDGRHSFGAANKVHRNGATRRRRDRLDRSSILRSRREEKVSASFQRCGSCSSNIAPPVSALAHRVIHCGTCGRQQANQLQLLVPSELMAGRVARSG